MQAFDLLRETYFEDGAETRPVLSISTLPTIACVFRVMAGARFAR
ncbi:hypothetical protein [Paracoccus sp. (in: a-proteobacteria)]